MALLSLAIHYVGLIVVCLCLLIVGLKVIWNFGLPYAMMREKHRGWSIFPVIESIPLLLAIGVSWLTSQGGVLSPTTLAVWGFGGILASYLHLAFGALIYGFVKWLQHS